jgi:hypothetical protein
MRNWLRWWIIVRSSGSACCFLSCYAGTDSNVLAAYLAHNPRLDANCTECVDAASDEEQAYLVPCVEYVRQHPLP